MGRYIVKEKCFWDGQLLYKGDIIDIDDKKAPPYFDRDGEASKPKTQKANTIKGGKK